MRRRAFSLAELLLAVALFAIIILGVLALSISVLKTERKAADTTVGKSVAQSLATRLLDQVRADSPVGTRANFLAYNTPNTAFQTGTSRVQRTDYQYSIFVSTVSDNGGVNVGSAIGNNRLKRMEVRVSWWAVNAGQTRAGYGQLTTSLCQLVAEGSL